MLQYFAIFAFPTALFFVNFCCEFCLDKINAKFVAIKKSIIVLLIVRLVHCDNVKEIPLFCIKIGICNSLILLEPKPFVEASIILKKRDKSNVVHFK